MNNAGHDKATVIGVAVHAKVGESIGIVCPRCGVDRDGRMLELQRWGHVFGFRVLPLTKLAPMIQCVECGYRAGTCVLEIPTAAVLAQRLEAAMRSAMATMVRAADNGDFDLTDDVLRTMEAAGYTYSAADLAADLVNTDDIETSARLHLLIDDLTPHGKQGFLHRMIAIALADGPFSTNERRALERMGVALGMAPPHIVGVLGTASQAIETAA